MYSIVLLGVLLLVIYLLFDWLWFNLVTRGNVPGPWGLPLLGVLLDFLRVARAGEFPRMLDDLRKAYGPVMLYRILGLGPIVQV